MSIVSILAYALPAAAFAGAVGPTSHPRRRGWPGRFQTQADAELTAALSPAVLSSGHIVLNVFLRRQP